MVIDKTVGYWNLIDSTRVDDIAYRLFLLDYRDNGNMYTTSFNFIPNQLWLFFKNTYNDEIVCKFYKKANNILRKEKLIEITLI